MKTMVGNIQFQNLSFTYLGNLNICTNNVYPQKFLTVFNIKTNLEKKVRVIKSCAEVFEGLFKWPTNKRCINELSDK